MSTDEKKGKKPGQNQPDKPDPNKQDIFDEESPKEGSSAAAEDAIRYFLRDRLHEFIGEMETALDDFEAWANSQQEDFKAAFNQRGFFEYLGQKFMGELHNLAGGPGKPLMDGLVGEVYNAASFAERSGGDLSLFVMNAMRRGTRDACWYVRDAAPFLLQHQWGKLLQLAANGGDQFIPTLYQLGLPSRAFKPAEFSKALQEHAEAYRRSLGLKRREVAQEQEQGEQGKKQQEIEEQAQKDLLNQEKKQAVAAG